MSRPEIASAKDRLRIPELWRLLELSGEPSRICHSPFREDRKASFSVYDDGRQAKDFATGDHFDAIDFLGKARGIANGEAVRQFLELANGRPCTPAPISSQCRHKVEDSILPDLSWLRDGSESELRQVANSRGLDFYAVWTAQDMGLLRFGEIRGLSSWILTDCSGRCAEGRRLNGKPYPACKTKQSELKLRKAHTIFCSKKNWPVGIMPAPEYRESFEAIALVEGGPDLLAAIHFALHQRRPEILPVAMLGRGVCLHGLHPESLDRFRGRRVRIYPHDDPDGGSYQNAIVWANQLERLDCGVDFFTFKGLRKLNGSPAKDLNDCVQLGPEQLQQLGELFP